MEASALLEKAEGYLQRWRTVGGFFRIAVFLATAVVGLLEWIGVSKIQSVAAAAAILLVWYVVWLFGSGRFILPSSRETVVISFDVDPEGQRQYNRITEALVSAVRSLRLSQPLRIKLAGPRVVTDVPSTSRYLERFGLTVVVWGTSRFGQIGGNKLLTFKVFHTFPVTEAHMRSFEQLKRDLSILYAGRMWNINEVNDLVDTEVVAEGLLEIALAIIGIDYYLRGRVPDGVVVFRRVVDGEVNRASGAETPSVKRYRELLYAGMAREAFDAHLTGDHLKAIRLIESLLPTYPNNIDLLMTLARATYYAGDEKKAVQYTMDIGRIDRRHPAVPANRAFFAIRKRNYAEVKRWYDRLIAARGQKYDILPAVSAFLEERYEEEPDEHAYLYGMAVVNGLADPLILETDLKEFLERTVNRTEYEPLRRRASELIRLRFS